MHKKRDGKTFSDRSRGYLKSDFRVIPEIIRQMNIKAFLHFVPTFLDIFFDDFSKFRSASLATLKSHQIWQKNEEKPCSTSLKPISSQDFRNPDFGYLIRHQKHALANTSKIV